MSKKEMKADTITLDGAADWCREEREREQLINAFHIRNAVSGRQDSPQTESELKRKQQPVI